MKKVLFFLLAIIFAIQGYGQTVQTSFGTTTQVQIPINTNWGYTYSQQIVTNAELIAGGLGTTYGQITKIRWFWDGSGDFLNCNDWKIYIGHTTKTSFTSTTDWIPLTGLTLVFDGQLTVPTSAGWFEFILQTPFTYNGTDNLVIAVDENTTNYTSLANYVSQTATEIRGIYYRSDSTNPDPASPPTATGTTAIIPNVQLYFLETCPGPGNLTSSAVTHENATVSWTPNGTETLWNLEYKISTDQTWTPITGLTTPTYTFNSLLPSTTYNVRVQANCGADQSAFIMPISFTTLASAPTTLPYTSDFENPTENLNWGFINGTQTNQWFIGDASYNPDVNNTVGGLNALYITNDAGLSWAYTLATSSTPSRVYAYRDFIVPVGTNELKLTIDWKANGNGYGDFLRVYWVPTDAVITAGSIPPGGLDISAALGTFYNNQNNNIHLQQATTWQTNEFVINTTQFPTLAGNTWRLLIHWRNENTSAALQPPATVDNISLVVVACATPSALAASNQTLNSIDLTWTDNGTSSSFNIQYKKSDETTWTTVQAYLSPYTLTNLEPSTSYDIRIQADCGTEQSFFTNTISSNTLCQVISTLPWQYGFEEVFTTNSLIGSSDVSAPYCWININGGAYTSYNWRRTTSTVRTGSGALQFYGGYYSPTSASVNKDWMISPIITLTGNERISFYANSNDPSYYMDDIAVYVFSLTDNQLVDIAAATDTTLFDLVMPATIVTANGSNWQKFEIDLSAYTGDIRFAFVRNYRNGGLYLNIDDITIDAIPACPDINQLSIVSSTSSDITLNWTYGTYANQGFELAYQNVETGFDPLTATIITIPDGTPLPYTVPGLLPAEFYSFAVRQACNGAWSNIVVTNTDGTPATLPYNCDFSDQTERASWKILNGSATNKFYIGIPSNVIAPIVGENLFISNTNGLTNNYNDASISTAIASRLIEFSGEGGYKLKFDLYIGGESTYDYIKVFLTDPDTTFVGSNTKPYYAINSYNGNNQLLTGHNNVPYFNGFIGNYPVVEGSFPREIVLPYQGPAGTVKKLIILWANDGSSGTQPPASIDNIIIEALNCPVPNTLATNNLTSTSTDITWVDPSGTATEWIFKWKPVASSTWTFDVATSTQFTLTNLTINTAYNVSIATVCGSDTGVYVNFYFATPCADITIPYFNNFDTETSFPTCWTRRLNQTYPYIYQYLSSSSPNSLYFYAYNELHYAATPPIDINVPVNTLQVSFKLYAYDLNTPVKFGVMTDPNNFSTFVQVGPTLYPSSSSTWEEKLVLLNNYAGTGRYIAIISESTGSISNSFYLDDFKIEVIPSCPKPQFLNANTTDVTATMFWTETGSAQEWEVEWGLLNFVQGQGTIASLTDTFLLVNGLTAWTDYQFYVRAVCGVGDTSLWAGPYTFNTQSLSPVTYLESFMSGTVAPAGYMSTTWYLGSPTAVPGNPAYNIYVNLYNSTPKAVTTTNIGPLQPNNILQFEYKLANYSSPYAPPAANSGNFVLAISTDWGVTYTDIDTVYNNAIAGYQTYNIDLSAYASEIVQFKITGNWNSGDYYLAVDNIYVGPAITCPTPSALVTSNPSTTSIDLGWTENGTATEWQIEYGPVGFTQGLGTFLSVTTNPPFTIPLLTPNNSYDFYVRSICSVGDTSMWSSNIQGTTLCLPSTLPFTEDFTSLSFPMCWTQTYSGALTSNRWSVGSDNEAGGTGNEMVCSWQEAIGISRLITPGIDFGTNTSATLSFKHFYSDYDPGVTLKIQSSTDLTTWTDQPYSIIGGTGDVGPETATLTLTIPTGVNYIAFVVDGNHYNINYWYIDDVTITSSTPVCAIPTNLAVNGVTSSTATATWSAGGTETQWEIAYKPTASATWMTAFVSPVATYNLPSLLAATAYDVKVRAICGAGDTSAYTAIVNFTTATSPCDIPTNVLVPTATITDQSAVVTWSAAAGQTQWQVEYKLVSSSNWTTMAVSTSTTQPIQALQSNSTYEVRVKAICSATNESAFTTPVQFTTTGAVTYTITATATGPGTISPAGTVIVTADADQTFTFTPTGTAQVVALLVDNQSTPYTNNEYTFTNVLANHTIAVDFAEGIDENSIANMVQLYPNPTNATIEIRLDETQLQVKECRVYDIYGKLLSIVPVYSDITKIDVTHFAAGVYFVRMNSDLGTITKKFVKK